MRLLVSVTSALIILSGCASVPLDTQESPDPIFPEIPEYGTIGPLEVQVWTSLDSAVAPTRLTVHVASAASNAIGDPLLADVAWLIDVAGPDTLSRSGLGMDTVQSMILDERGTYVVTVTVSAPRFESASATRTVIVDPEPLVGSIDVPNQTRGAWFTLDASALQGYSDQGYTCQWSQSDALQVLQPDSCGSPARWLLDGPQVAAVVIDDGHDSVTATQSVQVAPMPTVPMPRRAPEDAPIADDETETQLPHLNITQAWLHSDLDHLYVGLNLSAIPHEQATRGATYSVSFKPSWNGSIDAYRVVATHPLTEDGAPAPDAARNFTLERSVAGVWETLGIIDGEVSVADGIFWWTTPRAMLEAPLMDAVLTDLQANVDAASKDTAQGSDPYQLA